VDELEPRSLRTGVSWDIGIGGRSEVWIKKVLGCNDCMFVFAFDMVAFCFRSGVDLFWIHFAVI